MAVPPLPEDTTIEQVTQWLRSQYPSAVAVTLFVMDAIQTRVGGEVRLSMTDNRTVRANVYPTREVAAKKAADDWRRHGGNPRREELTIAIRQIMATPLASAEGITVEMALERLMERV